ncbi:MAG: redoxin domain-containing protein [Ignavibacteria bacterium]|nr:redoxin domain-containing protein [Ignavibacteria bacterium]
MMTLASGQKAVNFSTSDVLKNPLRLDTFRGKKVFLAFLRNTQCPICSLYVYQLLKITNTLRQNNTEMILFYESSEEKILRNPIFREKILNEKNLHVVSDPERKIYDVYGVEISPAKATMETLQAGNKMGLIQQAIELGFTGNGQEEGTHPDAVPAEFLVDERQMIVRAFYGADAADHLPLQELEAFALKSSAMLVS